MKRDICDLAVAVKRYVDPNDIRLGDEDVCMKFLAHLKGLSIYHSSAA